MVMGHPGQPNVQLLIWSMVIALVKDGLAGLDGLDGPVRPATTATAFFELHRWGLCLQPWKLQREAEAVKVLNFAEQLPL
jgi:hypothetical protein